MNMDLDRFAMDANSRFTGGLLSGEQSQFSFTHEGGEKPSPGLPPVSGFARNLKMIREDDNASFNSDDDDSEEDEE